MNDWFVPTKQVARISGEDASYLVELLRHVYAIRTCSGEEDLVLGDLIVSLDECDSIEIVDDEEYLVDAG